MVLLLQRSLLQVFWEINLCTVGHISAGAICCIKWTKLNTEAYMPQSWFEKLYFSTDFKANFLTAESIESAGEVMLWSKEAVHIWPRIPTFGDQIAANSPPGLAKLSGRSNLLNKALRWGPISNPPLPPMQPGSNSNYWLRWTIDALGEKYEISSICWRLWQ